MELFSITCTTCNARLTVRSMAAIGQILACPKCHSMVQIATPPGWTPPQAESRPAAAVPSQPQHKGSGKPPAQAMESPANAPAKVAVTKNSLDSDFSEDPATGEQEPPTALPTSIAMAPPAELIGKRIALGVGLAAGLALTLFMLFRPSDDEHRATATAQPAQGATTAASKPLVNHDSAPRQQVDASGTAAENVEHNQSADTIPDVLSDATEPRAKDAIEQSPSVPEAETAVARMVKDDESDRASHVADMPAIVATEKQSASRTEPPLAAKHQEPTAGEELPVDLTSEVSAKDREVGTRLEGRIAAIDFQRTRLDDLVEFLSRMANITLRFDPEALVAANIKTTAQVTVQQADTTVAKVLDAALDKLGLTHEIRDGQVVIVTRPDLPARPHAGSKPKVEQSDAASENEISDPAADLRLEAVKP
jgi:hypothetical protein